jgi:hypothetical protein
MTKQPFTNDATQAERREIVKNDAVTFHRFGLRDDGPGGRYAKTEPAQSVTGSTANPTYPQLPEGSPWRQWPPEPVGGDPLGVDVNEMVPVGSPAEIEASIRKLEAEREAEEDKPTAPEAGDFSLPAPVEPGLSSTSRRRRI